MRYHISKNGNPAQCKAVKKECPLGVDSPHFDTKEQAKEYIEKAEFELNEAFSKLSKKSSKVISEYTHDEKFKTFGVGKFRKLTTPNGKDWDESLNVEYRKCENFPEQYFDDDKWGDKLTDHEEVAVNGEIIGYIALKTPQRGIADYKVYVFETLEQANDHHARIINVTYGTRKSTIGDLIKHHQDYVKQSIDVDNPKKYFTNFKRGAVTSKKIDKNNILLV